MTSDAFAPITSVEKIEEGKLRDLEISIANYIKLAGPNFDNIIPLRKTLLCVSDAEGRSLTQTFDGEVSFRATYANTMRDLVVICARISTETEEYIQTEQTCYLWQKHAASLKYLVSVAQRAMERAEAVRAAAQNRGLTERVEAIDASRGRLDEVSSYAAGMLSRRESEELRDMPGPQLVYAGETA